MIKRRHISTRERVKIFRDAGGICHICKLPIQVPEAWQVEHVIPLEIGGEDGGKNLVPAHVHCHFKKTKQDVADIARAKRREARHIGAKAPTRTPIRGAGFPKKERTAKPSLPPRSIYKEI